GKRARQRSALWPGRGEILADPRRRLPAARRLGENQDARKRLLRHYLDWLPRRQGAREGREGLSRRTRSARQSSGIDSLEHFRREASARLASGQSRARGDRKSRLWQVFLS